MKLDRSWLEKCRQIAGLALLAVLGTFSGESAQAQSQITPDRTLGDESSQVRTNVEVKGNPAEVIEGGAQRGTNLFHSFEEFNIEDGRGAYFDNPTAVESIFSRVTGNNPSEISGTLGVSGNADLFFINPNGIIFGENARLDLDGSFVGSTASSILFEEYEFSASNPQNPPLLRINIPIGLGFQDEPGNIVNRSTARNSTDETVGLEVNPKNNLTLLGGNLNFDAGNVTAKGGSIRLGGLLAAGTIGINDNGSLNFPQAVSHGDVILSNAADVDVRGGEGNIDINARNLTLQKGMQSSIRAGIANDLTSNRTQAGDITINVAENIVLGNASTISNSVEPRAVGNAGNIKVTASNLNITNGAKITASTFGQGNAGFVDVSATDNIVLDGENSIAEGSRISSVVNNRARGNSDGIFVNAKNLTLNNGAVIIASTLGEGNAGNITVKVTENLVLDGETSESLPSSIASLTSVGAIGNAGDIEISTSNLSLTKGGLISAATFGQGNAGFVDVTALKNIVVESETSEITQIPNSISGLEDLIDPQLFQLVIPDDFTIPSSINSVVFTTAQGNAGGVNISTANLTIANGGEVSASTFGQGDAGGVNIEATESIFIDGEIEKSRTGISANALVSNGDGGNVDILTNLLSIENGGRIEASNFDSSNLFPEGTGQPGNVSIRADSISLTNSASIAAATQSETGVGGLVNLNVAENLTLRNNSFISAQAFNNVAEAAVQLEGSIGGIIDLKVDKDIILSNNSLISAQASNNANGGNLNIDTRFIIAVLNENNDIVASAAEGNGGNIEIDADSLFGIKERTRNNTTNDINASSEFGLSGTVEINTADVDPDRDLVQLPDRPTEKEVVQACDRNNSQEQSEFVVKGSGGLPPSPEEPLDSVVVEANWIDRSSSANSQGNIESISQQQPPIVEAQRWIVDENQEIVLVAANHSDNKIWQNLPSCPHSPFSQDRSQTSTISDRLLLASTKPKSLAAIPERIKVKSFELEGNQVFDTNELAEVLAPFTNKSLSFTELLQARSTITKYYTERGYVTSGAYIPQQRLQDRVVKVQIIEGYLEDVQIEGNKRLNSSYFSQRIKTANNALQQESILSALQLLQQDPLISNISAELEAGTRPGAGILTVEVQEADSLATPILLDNRRTPSIGSFRRQLAFREGNLLGFGDNLFLAYSNTQGSDAFDGSYALPINARNGTLTVRGGFSSSEIVEEPFDQLNILGDSQYYELSLRQPVSQTPTQEFALGVTASRRLSDISSLLEEFDIPPSELAPGADESGETRISALRFFQEWTRRNRQEVIAARSQFNLGLNIFNATVNKDAPDSRFFSWQGQAQWTRRLAPDTSFLLRGGIQLAGTSLLSSEQFGLGGLSTLRGYRQDLLLTDNAAFASAEIRLPVAKIERLNSTVQLAPFFDVGTAWNNNREPDNRSNTLASIGLGLRLLFDNFTARFDWGIPLISIDSNKDTWQENGLHFSLEYNPF